MKKQVLVSVDRAETRVALLEASGTPAASRSSRCRQAARAASAARGPEAGYRVAELYIERRGGRSIVGNIYKGKVDNVLPGLEAAFVDIGLEKNGFLHVDEIVLPGVETPKRGRGGGGGGRKISDLLKPGQEIVVQVVKDPLKTKGARLSMELTIAGRYMVYAPTGEGIGVSRRLEDSERERLRRQTANLALDGGGVIIRTAAHGAKREDFERELKYLHKLHEVLVKRVEDTVAPDLVFQEADLSVRVVRDIFSAHFERAIVDDEQQFHRLVSFFTRTAPELVERVELWQRGRAAVRGLRRRQGDRGRALAARRPAQRRLPDHRLRRGADGDRRQLRQLHRPRQGRGAGGHDHASTNLEAAEEVVNQLRLRDIGGIIVIDFIDMARARNRDAVMKTLRKTLDEDRTKTFTAEISKLGLVEMTRQNVTEGVREIMSRPCPTCEGEGVIRSEETIAIEFERRLRDVAVEHPDAEAFLVQINPRVSTQFTGHGSRVLHALEAQTGQVVPVRGLRRARAGPLRDHLHGHPRGGRGARAALPPGRRGARGDRRAAHVRRRRRGRQNRRLHHLDRRRRAVRGREADGPHRPGRDARPPARCCSTTSGEVVRRRPPAQSARAARARRGRRRTPARRSRPRDARGPTPRGAARRATARTPRRAAKPGSRVPSAADRLRARGGARRNGARPPRPASGGEGGEDGLQSKPRRRGRRGGRRRSAAKAKATPSSAAADAASGAAPARIETDTDMYAIVKTGGKQYRVERGQTPARRAARRRGGRRRGARADAVPLR